VILRVCEATTAKRMQIDPYCQRCKCDPVNVDSSHIRVMQIIAWFGRYGASNKGVVGKISDFLALSVNISKTVPDTAKVTIND